MRLSRSKKAWVWNPITAILAILCLGIIAIFLLSVRNYVFIRLQSSAPEGGALQQIIPSYFRVGANSEREAQENWAKTLRWRESEGVDMILKGAPEHDHELVNRYMPTQIYLGRDNDGNLVAVDRWGEVDMETLLNKGVTFKMLIRHYIFQLEYLWAIAAPSEHEKVTLIMDMANVSFEQLTPFNCALIKERVRIGCEYYPNRGATLYMVNVPNWIAYPYALLLPFLSDETKSKLVYLSSDEVASGALLRNIPSDQLPPIYGGTSNKPLGESKWDLEQKALARRLHRSGIKRERRAEQNDGLEWWKRFQGDTKDGDYWEE